MIVAIDDVGVDSCVPAEGYEDFLERGGTEPLRWMVDDEERAISINYTSGTTGRPKGVMYTHRGAYLNALGEVVHSQHSSDSVYLWTLPMFHCNGWCTTWAVTAVGGRHVCLRAVEPSDVWRLLRDEGVTHLNGAPTVLISLVNAPEAAPLGRPLTVTTAGAPPSPTIIGQIDRAWRADRPRLRPDRDLRSLHGVRAATRLGRPRRRGSGPAAGPSGCRLRDRRPGSRRRPPTCATCPGTAPLWARW